MSKKNKNKKNNKLSSCTLYVDGMHCASCEILIEKKLLKYDNIKSVDASLNKNRVTIRSDKKELPDIDELNEEFSDLGYRFSDKKFYKDNSPLIRVNSGKLIFNKSKLVNTSKLLVIFLSLFAAFIIFERLQLGQFVSVDSTSSLPAFFILGLVAGFSSCAALIGGLLLSMTKQWNEVYIDSDSQSEKAKPHILFHLGRLISFFLLGGMLGLIGEVISLNSTVLFSILTIVVSIMMLILAFQMLGVEWANNIKFSAPKFLTKYSANETNFKGKYMPFLTGFLTFFLPCGFTLVAQTIALTSGSFAKGSMIMLFFAFGTLPVLLGISFSGLAFNRKPHLTAKFNTIAGLVIIFFVVYNLNGQLNVLGFPSFSDLLSKESTENIKELVKVNEVGEQVIKITAKGFEYIPKSSTTIKSGIPTIIEVDNQGILGCGAFIAANGLFPDYVGLEEGINKISFIPEKGTYKLTCTMGMVPPVLIRVT